MKKGWIVLGVGVGLVAVMGLWLSGTYNSLVRMDEGVSQAWAQAIHDADPRWQGIRYVSRQMNKGFAYAIFQRSGLKKLRSEKVKVAQLDALCDLFNVAAV